MLPGMDGTGELFGSVVSCLDAAIESTVCCYPNDPDLHYEELQQFAGTLLPEDEPFVVLGESFSGPVAVMLAARQSENLRGLILVSTFLRSPKPWLLSAALKLPDIAFANKPRMFVKQIVAAQGIETDPVTQIHAVASGLDTAVIRSRLQCIDSVDVRDLAGDIKVPVCTITGRDDKLVSAHNARELGSYFDNVETNAIAGNHFVLQTSPEKSADIISRFCREQG